MLDIYCVFNMKKGSNNREGWGGSNREWAKGRDLSRGDEPFVRSMFSAKNAVSHRHEMECLLGGFEGQMKEARDAREDSRMRNAGGVFAELLFHDGHCSALA